MIKTILEDKRPIKSVTAQGVDGDYWHVGWRSKSITKIVPYHEKGQGAYVTWLAVYSGDVIIERINCAAVESIAYTDEATDP